MTIPKYILAAYLIIINIAAFIVYRMDKRRAKRRMWRIPERTLLTIAALGGSLGALISMDISHHKIKHLRFSLGVPTMFVIHAALIAFLWLHL